MRPQDILAFNSANKPSFQNPTKKLFAPCSIEVKSAVTFLHFLHLWTIVQKGFLSDFEKLLY